ncbi:MAG: hypothetical protein JXA82_03385 [Sedimentisphaerales bacterium]|nr:hypothetical protein [Sedimentisphaerales bacterium]
MKTIVEGKLYDTKSAEEFCAHSYSRSDDFNYKYEALYRSPNGKFSLNMPVEHCRSIGFPSSQTHPTRAAD